MAAAVATPPAETDDRSGLTGFDWFVIVAAAACLIGAAVWLVQGGQLPGQGAPAPAPVPTE